MRLFTGLFLVLALNLFQSANRDWNVMPCSNFSLFVTYVEILVSKQFTLVSLFFREGGISLSVVRSKDRHLLK